MGKGGKKKKKNKGGLDVASIFDSTKPASEHHGWKSGVSAMALDEPNAAAGPSGAATGAGAGEEMDTSDFIPFSKAKQQGGLRLQKASMKISKRGSRTTTQKKRKAAKQEKALAHAEKAATRTSGKVKRKQQVAALKSLY